MKDEQLRAAFVWGAGTAVPAPEMWERVQTQIAVRTRRTRLLIVAAVLLFFTAGTVTLSPAVRAAVKGAIVTLWQTRFGATPVQLDWDARNAEPSEYYTFETFATPQDAAAYLGFQPALARVPEASQSSEVQAYRGANVRIARVSYTMPQAPFPYAVETTGWFQADGAPLPPQELKLLTISELKPVNIREEQIDNTSALCFELSGSRLSACVWLQGGFRIGVSGPDPAMVLKLAKSISP